MKTVIRFMQTLLLTAAFCFPAEASASDTDNIMVREDRVWQQNLYLGDVWDEWFDGTTVIGGKNYHNLHFRETKDGKVQEFIIAYMREEGGKVYMIAAKLEPEQYGRFMGAVYRNYDTELLVYDFNLEEGDVMRLTADPAAVPDDIWPPSKGRYFNEWKVMKKYVMEYGGTLFDAFEVETFNNGRLDDRFTIITGLGGMRSAMCFPGTVNMYDCSEGRVVGAKLLDRQGNVLYDPTKDKFVMPKPVLSPAKMVIKDRAWWYTLDYSSGDDPLLWDHEFGLQIGDEVDIDGVAWHEINVVKRGDGEYHWTRPDETDPICISYIREERGSVFALLDADRLAEYPNIYKVMQHSRWAQYISPDPKPVQIYFFGEKNDIFRMGDGDDAALCQVMNTENKFFGIYDDEYLVDAASMQIYGIGFRNAGFMDGNSAMTVVEGVGAYTSDKEHISLFFAPLTDNGAESGFTVPVLRYVTDGEYSHNAKVVFEGAGGWQQWQFLVSSPDIETAPVDGTERWFGIDGVEVVEPLSPGLYIKVTGGRAVKTLVR